MLAVPHVSAVCPYAGVDFGVHVELADCSEGIGLVFEALDLKNDCLGLVEELCPDPGCQDGSNLALGQALKLFVLEPVEADGTTHVDVRKCKFGCRHSIIWKPIETLSDVISILGVNGDLAAVQSSLDVSDKLSRLTGQAHSQSNVLPLRSGSISIGEPFLQKDDAHSGDYSENGSNGLNPGWPVWAIADDFNRNAHSLNAGMILTRAA